MFSKVKKLFKPNPNISIGDNLAENAINFHFAWYEPGPNNPFKKRYLDIRCYTLNRHTPTLNKNVEKKFIQLRNSSGIHLRAVEFDLSHTLDCQLRYKHTFHLRQGILFKAKSITVKWDIYLFDNTLYFTRSLSGDLLIKARVSLENDIFTVSKVEYAQSDLFYDQPELALSYVHFILRSHLLKHSLPHPIPDFLQENEPMDIARFSYNQFGKMAWFATKDGILDIGDSNKNNFVEPHSNESSEFELNKAE